MNFDFGLWYKGITMAKTAIDLLVEEFISDMVSAYDPGDPVMGHYGREKWEAQVQCAAEELRSKVECEVQKVTDKLDCGDFFER